MELVHKFNLSDKMYFDIIVHGVKIRHCFVEIDERGNKQVRFPTKKNETGIHQTIYFEDKDIFYEVIKEAKKLYEEVH